MSRVMNRRGNHREINLLLRRLDNRSPLVESCNETGVEFACDELFVAGYFTKEGKRRSDTGDVILVERAP